MKQQGYRRILSLMMIIMLALYACESREESHAEHDHAIEETTAEFADDEHDHLADVADTQIGDEDPHGAAETRSASAQVHLSERERAAADLGFAEAGPRSLGQRITLPGEIEIDADRLAHIVPRVAGIVREVRARLGDVVAPDQVLAIIDSRELADAKAEYLAAGENLSLSQALFEREESLHAEGVSSEQEYLDARRERTEDRIALRASEQKLLALGLSKETLAALPRLHEATFTEYALAAPIAGTVIDKHIVLGEALESNAEVFVLADLNRVWAILDVYQKDLPLIRAGQHVSLRDESGRELAAGEIDFVAPLIGEETRTATARVVLENPDGTLRPGTFVTAVVDAGEEQAAVAVPLSALQNLDGESVIFVPAGDAFAARSVELGRRDGAFVEILGGLRAGERIVSEGAFALKAKLVTSGLDPHAGHGH